MADIVETAQNLLLPVMEAAVVLAAHYAKATGRDCVTATDMKYGLMYAARRVAGQHSGSIYPEIYDENSSDEEAEEVEEGDEEPFTRYEGTEELFVSMNECADTWDEWVPDAPLYQMLKNAVDKIEV